jgi:aspartyl-tRNA(Asn)/glutamyl-tRNA(Gln) amidotransferase subunit C
MEPLTADQVRHIAILANLHLTEEEVETYRHQLTGILDHIQSLQLVDTSGVEPTGHATDSATVLRDDEDETPLERDQVIGNAASTSAEFIRVSSVMD